MAKSQPEQDLVHRPIAQYLDVVCKQAGFYWTTFPGGGKRPRVEAAIFKGLGVKPGVADILIISIEGRAFWAECKAPATMTGRKATPSKVQLEFATEMRNRNSPYTVVRSIDDMKSALKHWGLLSHQTPQKATKEEIEDDGFITVVPKPGETA